MNTRAKLLAIAALVILGGAETNYTLELMQPDPCAGLPAYDPDRDEFDPCYEALHDRHEFDYMTEETTP